MCGKKGRFARDSWSRGNQDRTVNEVEGAEVDSDVAEEFVFTIENIVKYFSTSPSGCEGHEDGLVMIDSGASVNFCLEWFGESLRNQTDQFNSEVRTEEHSKIAESVLSGEESEAAWDDMTSTWLR